MGDFDLPLFPSHSLYTLGHISMFSGFFQNTQWYLSYLVFDQQKIGYYEVFGETYHLSDSELRC